MRGETGDSAVAVEERVDPEQSTVAGGDGHDLLGLGEPPCLVGLTEAGQEPRHGARADGYVVADLDIRGAQLPRLNRLPLAGLRVDGPAQLVSGSRS